MALLPSLLLAMAAAAAPPPDGLEGSSWVLSTLGGQPVRQAPAITLRIAEGQATGSDGCNRYRAPVALDGNSFRIQTGAMVSTKMACPPEVMTRASKYTTALAQARRVDVEGQRLTLRGEDDSVLATFEMQSRDLPGTVWEVTGLNNGRQGVVSILPGSSLTLRFTSDGEVSGSAGCNRYSARFTADGEKVTIHALASTRKKCSHPPKVMEQEAQFLRALKGAATARMEGDDLELRDALGALMVGATR